MMKTLPKFGPCGSDSASVAVTVANPPTSRYSRRFFSTRDGVARYRL